MSNDSTTRTITRQLVAEADRLAVTARLFGRYFPLRLEPYIYSVASEIAPQYQGGFWIFFQLSNGGFYMAPDSDQQYQVRCSMNYFEGQMSADALGIVACLTAYSHLSFSKSLPFARGCAEQFHWLRSYAMGHAEVEAIFAAID